MTDEKISLIVSDGKDYRSSSSTDDIKVSELKKNFSHLVQNISGAFDGIKGSIEGASLKEVTISVEVGAKGKLSLLGSGLSAHSKGGILLKFEFDNAHK